MTTPKTDPLSLLIDAIDGMLARLRVLDEEAALIRAALKTARRRMASGGTRAGEKARSGKKRKARDRVGDETVVTTEHETLAEVGS